MKTTSTVGILLSKSYMNVSANDRGFAIWWIFCGPLLIKIILLKITIKVLVAFPAGPLIGFANC